MFGVPGLAAGPGHGSLLPVNFPKVVYYRHTGLGLQYLWLTGTTYPERDTRERRRQIMGMDRISTAAYITSLLLQVAMPSMASQVCPQLRDHHCQFSLVNMTFAALGQRSWLQRLTGTITDGHIKRECFRGGDSSFSDSQVHLQCWTNHRFESLTLDANGRVRW